MSIAEPPPIATTASQPVSDRRAAASSTSVTVGSPGSFSNRSAPASGAIAAATSATRSSRPWSITISGREAPSSASTDPRSAATPSPNRILTGRWFRNGATVIRRLPAVGRCRRRPRVPAPGRRRRGRSRPGRRRRGGRTRASGACRHPARPVSGSRVVRAQRGSSRITERRASPARTLRPTHSSSSCAPSPSTRIVGRKRRGSKPSRPPRRPTSAADASESSETGCESSARIPSGSSSMVSGRPTASDTASDHGPSISAALDIAAPEVGRRGPPAVHGGGHLGPVGQDERQLAGRGVVAALDLGERTDLALRRHPAGRIEQREAAVARDAVALDLGLGELRETQRLHGRDVDGAHRGHDAE